MSETELAEQGEVVRAFLLDLLDAFGLDGEVTATPAEEGAVELDVTGGDLGLLIGPKGQTLQAIQELSRSALQRQKPGETHARIRVDVSGYRQRRREALERFVQGIAAEVKATGVRKALEPMSPPDRKVVHDTVNEIDGRHHGVRGRGRPPSGRHPPRVSHRAVPPPRSIACWSSWNGRDPGVPGPWARHRPPDPRPGVPRRARPR